MKLTLFYPLKNADKWKSHIMGDDGAPLCGDTSNFKYYDLKFFRNVTEDQLCPTCAGLRDGAPPILKDGRAFSTWIYVIQIEDTDYHKIGISTNVKQRLAELQANNPMQLRVVWKVGRFTQEDARSIEKDIHERCQEYRVGVGGQREWFRFHSEYINHIQQLVDELCS